MEGERERKGEGGRGGDLLRRVIGRSEGCSDSFAGIFLGQRITIGAELMISINDVYVCIYIADYNSSHLRHPRQLSAHAPSPITIQSDPNKSRRCSQNCGANHKISQAQGIFIKA